MDSIEKWVGKRVTQGISAEDVQSFIDKSLEEGLSLEYKSIASLKNPEKLRKSICAFANSDGGLLVIGAARGREGKGASYRVEWNTDPRWNMEWLQDVTVNLIRPTVQGVQIVSVVNSADENLFLVDIPASINPPHMADGVYYFRNGAESLPMEHFQVADAFGKRRRPILRPTVSLSSYDSGNNIVDLTYSVANDGHTLAKWIMANIRFSFCRKLESLGNEFWTHVDEKHYPVTDSEEWTATYQSPIHVLHPGMWRQLGRVRVHLEHPLTLVAVTVGAEDATTDTYISIISKDWLTAKANAPGYLAVTLLALPMLGCGSLFNFDGLEKLRPLAESVEKDIEHMPQEVMFKMIEIAMVEFGNDAFLSLSEKAQALIKKHEADEYPGSSIKSK
jgi:hypothetical protein